MSEMQTHELRNTRKARKGGWKDDSSTEYDGMPRSAIATRLVDYELPPAEIPARPDSSGHSGHLSHLPSAGN